MLNPKKGRSSQGGDSSSGVISFCLFIPFMGFSRQEYWSSLPFPPPVVRNIDLVVLSIKE